MKRKLLIATLGFLALLVLLFVLARPAAPLLARLGIVPICIQGQWPRLQVVPCPDLAALLPPLEPARARPVAADAHPTLIDTDMAPDDWMAILYLLERPDVDVKGITVAGDGEAHCGPGTQNALNLAGLSGRPGAPVACGRQTPLQGDHAFPQAFRDRADSLAGLSLPSNPNSESGRNAVELLTTTLLGSPEKVTIVALGPLTNLAEAFQVDPSLVDRVEMVYIMGGAFEVQGNLAVVGVSTDNTAAEWNMYIDPRAAAVVLGTGVPITFVPLDATNQAPITEDFYYRLKADRSRPAAEFVYRLLTRQFDLIRAGSYWFWDPLAATISTDESLATFAELSVTVVDEESPQSGATRVSDEGNLARIATTIDRERFETLFLAVLNGRLP